MAEIHELFRFSFQSTSIPWEGRPNPEPRSTWPVLSVTVTVTVGNKLWRSEMHPEASYIWDL